MWLLSHNLLLKNVKQVLRGNSPSWAETQLVLVAVNGVSAQPMGSNFKRNTCPFKIRPMDCSEMPWKGSPYALHYNSEQRRPHLPRGISLKSLKFSSFYWVFLTIWTQFLIWWYPKGRFTHSMPCPCRAHAVTLPFRAAKVFEICFSHLIKTVRSCLIHTCHAVPMSWQWWNK